MWQHEHQILVPEVQVHVARVHAQVETIGEPIFQQVGHPLRPYRFSTQKTHLSSPLCYRPMARAYARVLVTSSTRTARSHFSKAQPVNLPDAARDVAWPLARLAGRDARIAELKARLPHCPHGGRLATARCATLRGRRLPGTSGLWGSAGGT